MKRWQIEQILYLNDVEKNKLALPQTPQLSGMPLHVRSPQKENILKRSLRRGLGILVASF